MNSSLYECEVMHHRLSPKENRFTYRIFLFALDLDEIPALAKRLPLFSHNRWNLYTFRDRDHLTLPGLEKKTVRENLRTWLAGEGFTLPDDARVLLVTLPRILGYIFNPVSFYFCTDAHGTPLCSVAQVCNTFGEMKPYLLTEREGDRFRRITPKNFYVSPFSPLDLAFDFKLRIPGERLSIHIDDREGEKPVLLSTLKGPQVPLTNARLFWFAFKYPLLTLRVIFLIHWHALKLWLRKLPWYAKADNPHLQQQVFRPHASIAGRNS